MSTQKSLTIAAALVYIGILIAAITGWVLNIIDIVQGIGGPLTALFAARCVGAVVFPLGAILGIFF